VEKGYTVKALRRHKTLPYWIDKKVFENVQWLEADILDIISLEDAMEDTDVVIHSAAIVSFLRKDRKAMYHTNIEGTANVVNAALEKKVRKLVHISSVAAVGRTASGGHVNEEKKWEDVKINTHYAISKHKSELQVWRGFGEGLETVILNPSTILGFGNWNNGSSAIFKNVFEEFKWYAPGTNGFVDVADVARAAVLLMESSVSGERFIVNGDNWPFKRLQDTIAENFSKKKPTRKTNATLLGIAWRLEKIKSWFTGRRPLLTKESARVAVSKTYFDTDKIREALPGFSFTPLEKTIQNACEKYAELTRNLQPK